MIGLPHIDMQKATRLTREGRLQDALAVLQGRHPTEPQDTLKSTSAAVPARPDVIDLSPPTEPGGSWSRQHATLGTAEDKRPAQRKRGLGEVIREKLRQFDPQNPQKTVPVPAGARFEERSFSCDQGSRRYRLYVPTCRDPGCPLVVMLHGCTQSPEDFAIGTGMNDLAERDGFIVAYPAQPQSANPSKCWNWFRPEDQRRDAGEPAIIAGITQAITAEFDVDPSRVYVAGLSAGGATAVVMGEAYPDLYAAIGVHSGLPYRSAHDVPSALAVMRGGSRNAPDRTGRRLVPTIVFHGDRDRTVHPSNGEKVIDGLRAGHYLTEASISEVYSGSTVRRSVLSNADGVPMIEHWRIIGAGHAWSGGNADGSFVDPTGPRASEEMIRFFSLQRAGQGRQ